MTSARETRFWPFWRFFPQALFAVQTPNFSFFARPLFITSTFLHFFHGLRTCFHGRRFKGIYSISLVSLVEFFTGIDFVFTGGILQKFSRAYFVFHVHFSRDFHIFHGQFFSFFSWEKKYYRTKIIENIDKT